MCKQTSANTAIPGTPVLTERRQRQQSDTAAISGSLSGASASSSGWR